MAFRCRCYVCFFVAQLLRALADPQALQKEAEDAEKEKAAFRQAARPNVELDEDANPIVVYAYNILSSTREGASLRRTSAP